MKLDESFWIDDRGNWELPSFLTRSLCHAARDKQIGYSELYYILDSLEAKERFADYWDNPNFYQSTGLSDHAIHKVDKKRDGWRTEQGNLAWEAGDTNAATEFYKQSIMHGDSCYSGWGGLFRISFSKGNYELCSDIFLNLCPPHEFYSKDCYPLESKYLNSRKHPNFHKKHSLGTLNEQRKGTSPYFISTSLIMAKAVIYSLLQSKQINSDSILSVSDFFELPNEDVSSLSSILHEDKTGLDKITNYIIPKHKEQNNTLKSLLKAGETERAVKVVKNILNNQKLVTDLTERLYAFLSEGQEEILDEVISTNPPFGCDDMDRIIFEQALEQIAAMEIADDRQLLLLRKFGLITTSPWMGSPIKKKFGLEPYSLVFEHIIKLATNTGENPNPIDVLIGIINAGSRLGFSPNREVVCKNQDWSLALLTEFLGAGNPPTPSSSYEDLVEYLKNAYEFLEQKYIDARTQNRWVNEELLTKAIRSLFGKDNVEQHAHPLWLTPQHLDIYLPKFNLAIEYMGKQHYEPVEYFGGQKGFEDTIKRDERKKDICQRMGIELIYVTHKEDVGKRAIEIHKSHKIHTAEKIG